jgi:hypothetical protein
MSGVTQVAIFAVVSGMSTADAVPLIPVFTVWGSVSGALVGWVGTRGPTVSARDWKRSTAPSG